MFGKSRCFCCAKVCLSFPLVITSYYSVCMLLHMSLVYFVLSVTSSPCRLHPLRGGHVSFSFLFSFFFQIEDASWEGSVFFLNAGRRNTQNLTSKKESLNPYQDRFRNTLLGL